jgi:hypothetical protein
MENRLCGRTLGKQNYAHDLYEIRMTDEVIGRNARDLSPVSTRLTDLDLLRFKTGWSSRQW